MTDIPIEMPPDASMGPIPIGHEVLDYADRIANLFDLQVQAAHRAMSQAFEPWQCRGARVPELEVAERATKGALDVFRAFEHCDARSGEMSLKLEALHSESTELAIELTSSYACEDFDQASRMGDLEAVAKLLDIGLPIFGAVHAHSPNRRELTDKLCYLLENCLATSGDALERENFDMALRGSRLNEMAAAAKAARLTARVLEAIREQDWKGLKLQ